MLSNSPVSKKLKGSPKCRGETEGKTCTDDAEANDVDGDVEDEDVEDHQVASLWLEGMGLDKKDFPTLDPSKVKLYPCVQPDEIIV